MPGARLTLRRRVFRKKKRMVMDWHNKDMFVWEYDWDKVEHIKSFPGQNILDQDLEQLQNISHSLPDPGSS